MNEYPPQDNQPPQQPQQPFNDPTQQYPQQQLNDPWRPSQHTSYPPQQPNTQYPPQQPFPGTPPPPQPSKPLPHQRIWPWFRHLSKKAQIIICVVLVLSCALCAGVSAAAGNTPTAQVAATPAPTATATMVPTATPTTGKVVPQVTEQPTEPPTPTPTPTPKPTPTDTPVPTESPAQVEKTYKDGTTQTTVSSLDKDGNSDQGKNVTFTCQIVKFVKDDSGNTAGANVNDPNDPGVFVQIAFPDGTDLSQLNENDTLVVWGLDDGVSSGTNAFGATVQEVVVSALYLTDQTTGYQTH